jgi:hypothetical protein
VFGNCWIGWLPLNGLRSSCLGDVGCLDSGGLGVKYGVGLDHLKRIEEKTAGATDLPHDPAALLHLTSGDATISPAETTARINARIEQYLDLAVRKDRQRR